MPVIKRYPNRKLYDTEAKQYVTLEGIASLVREGQDVHVVDHATGEDLTALTLTQVVLDQEKKAGGLVPNTVLSGLVKAGGKTLSALRHSLASPLGFWGLVDDEVTRRIEALVTSGELTEQEGVRLRQKLITQSAPAQDKPLPLEEEVKHVLDRRGLPTHEDYQRLIRKLDALAAKLDRLGTGEQPVASTRRPRKKQT